MYVSQMEGVTDKFRSRIIGVSGVAGAGKDTFFKLLKASLNAREINCVNLSIADSLKNDLKPFCKKHYGIDPTNCKRSDKNLLRPLMVFHGITMRNISEGRHWINKVNKEIKKPEYEDYVKVITDVRFNQFKKDEVHWLKNELGGVLVHVSQFSEHKEEGKEPVKDFLRPVNVYEEINDPKVREEADYRLEWKKVSDPLALSPHIRKFLKWMEKKD